MVTSQPSYFQPALVQIVDIDRPLPIVAKRLPDDPSKFYERAVLFVRIHEKPVGMIELSIPNEEISPEDLANEVWARLSVEINDHLKGDGQPAIEGLSKEGFETDETPPCWEHIANGDLPFISVVIATRDRPGELERNLHSILQLSGPPFEVIVVDNASATDATKKLIAESFANDPRVRYVAEPRAGISPARNRGAQEANGEIIAFTDDDVLVDNNWLRAIASRFKANPEADVVTGVVLPAAFDTHSQLLFEEYGGFNKGYSPHLFTSKREPEYSPLYPFTAGSFGSGNNMAFRTDAFKRFGGFDTRLGVGSPARSGEDLDLYLSIILSGGTIAYEPAAIISHFHRADYQGLRHQLFNYGVGLSALYTKWLLLRPMEVLSRVPRGLWFLLSPKSAKNQNRSEGFPRDLVFTELRGMLYGPIAFLRHIKLGKDSA